jgi:four helix bundle protein
VAAGHFRDLRVWQLGMRVVEQVYRVTRGFPAEERWELSSQMRRAAVSVASNIAEGHTRQSRREYLHHLSMARASAAELETQFEIALRLGYIHGAQAEPAMRDLGTLSRHLTALRNALSPTAPDVHSACMTTSGASREPSGEQAPRERSSSKPREGDAVP